MQIKAFANWVLFVLSCLIPATLTAAGPTVDVPYFNTWLIAGTFANDEANTGFAKDWIGETSVQPSEGDAAGSTTWRYFDDRLFSRAYDCYNDVFSYYTVKRKESATAKVVYVHTWVFSPAAADAELAIGADNEFKCWLNGTLAGQSEQRTPWRDTLKYGLKLQAGWNRLLLKVANQNQGRLGFYARLSDHNGKTLPGVLYSVNSPKAADGKPRPLGISTKAMEDIDSPSLPIAYKEWPYGAMDSTPCLNHPERFQMLETLSTFTVYGAAPYSAQTHAPKSPDFRIQAEGGVAPYRFELAKGAAPEGLVLMGNGAVRGIVSDAVPPGEYPIDIRVTDSKGASAVKRLSFTVKERPNKWMEEARLIGLIHAPQLVADADIVEMAKLMKRQGYQVAMPVGYGNGWPDWDPRWPSAFSDETKVTGVMEKYRKAMNDQGITFGMYLGEMGLPKAHRTFDNTVFTKLRWGTEVYYDGTVLLVEEAMRVCKPKVIFFDHAGILHESTDAFFSVIRATDPDAIIIKNGFPTMCLGDWDLVCMEGMWCLYDGLFERWPVQVEWPKKTMMESWRHMTEPGWENSYKGPLSPKRQLQLIISLIGDGYIADIDHSASFGLKEGLTDGMMDTKKSVMWQCHAAMADWVSPATGSSLAESFTQVVNGPLPRSQWGYNLLDAARRTKLYLHIMNNGVDRSGFDSLGTTDQVVFTEFPATLKIRKIILLNRGIDLKFVQSGVSLEVTIPRDLRDEVDTILRCELLEPATPLAWSAPKAGANLAHGKPCQILSLDGSHPLPPNFFCSVAENAVDGDVKTVATGSMEWPWALQVDLQSREKIQQVVVTFGTGGFATDYQINVSLDGKKWDTVAAVSGNDHTGRFVHTFNSAETRYLRVCGMKPDGPNQKGSQMSLSELEVYATPRLPTEAKRGAAK